MTWEVALGVIALFGFVISCATVAARVSKAIGSFEVAVADLKATLKEFKDSARDTHKELYGRLSDHEQKLGDHETRISILEKDKEGEK